jgi:hypothetical protein
MNSLIKFRNTLLAEKEAELTKSNDAFAHKLREELKTEFDTEIAVAVAKNQSEAKSNLEVQREKWQIEL